MKTIILLIALILCNLSFSCEILPNGNYIPCYTNITEIIERIIENEKIISNIEYNVKLAESRLNEAKVKYGESIKKYNTTRHNAASNSFIKSLIKQKVNAYIAKQKANADIAKQKSNADIVIQKAYYEANAQQEAYFEINDAIQKATYEMIVAKDEYLKASMECDSAKNEYLKARMECDRIYDLVDIVKGEFSYSQVGKKSK